MISAAKIDANRKNAEFSTGPRSARGRMRAAQNARRHGLSVPIAADPKLSAEVRAIVHKIAGGSVDPNVRACAHRVAEAHVDLDRIRKIRMEMLARTTPALAPTDDIEGSGSGPRGDLIGSLARLTRYERRAMSRLKRAIREFDKSWAQS